MGQKKRSSNRGIDDEPSPIVVRASTAVTPILSEFRRTPHKAAAWYRPASSDSRDSGVYDHLCLASAAADLTRRRPKLNLSTLLGISLYFPMHIPLQKRATHDIGDPYADDEEDAEAEDGILNLRGMPLGIGGHFRIPRQMSKIFEGLEGLPANDLNVQLSKISHRIEKNFMFAVPQYLKYFQARLGSEGMPNERHVTVFAVDRGENPEERGCQLRMSVDMIRYSHFVTTNQFGRAQNTSETWSDHLKALYTQACFGHI